MLCGDTPYTVMLVQVRVDFKENWGTSQDAKVDLKPLIVSVIPIYGLSDTINLFCVLVFILINKLITFSAS